METKSQNSLHSLVTNARGATVVTSKGVANRMKELNSAPSNVLTISGGSNEEEKKALEYLNNLKAGQPKSLVVAVTSVAAKKKKSKLAEPEPEVSHVPKMDKKLVKFKLNDIGEFENSVRSVIIDGQVMSLWDDLDSQAQGKFRAKHGLNLTIVYNDTEYEVWSPGIHIDNAELGQTVSVYVLK